MKFTLFPTPSSFYNFGRTWGCIWNNIASPGWYTTASNLHFTLYIFYFFLHRYTKKIPRKKHVKNKCLKKQAPQESWLKATKPQNKKQQRRDTQT